MSSERHAATQPHARTMYECPRCGYASNRVHNFKTHCNAKRSCPPRVANVTRPLPTEAHLHIRARVHGQEGEQEQERDSMTTRTEMAQGFEDFRRDVCCRLDRVEMLLRAVLELDSSSSHEDDDEDENDHEHRITAPDVPRVLDFGYEDVTGLFASDDEMHNALLDKNHGLMRVLTRTFFNPDKPQNYNVRIANLKHNIAECVQSGQWVSMRLTKAVENIIRRAQALLFDRYLSDAQYRSTVYEHHQDVFDWQIRLNAGERKTYSAIAGDVKAMLLDRYKNDRQCIRRAQQRGVRQSVR